MKYKPKVDSIIFDLDGTLWDASESIALAWKKASEDLGMNVAVDAAIIRSVSGLPFDECIERVFGKKFCKDEKFKELMDVAEKWKVSGEGGKLYPGVRELIPELAKKYRLYMVSNCQDWYLNCFLDKSGLGRYFVATACYGQNGLSKTDNIKKLVKNNFLKKPLYVGDTVWDQQAAFYAGTKFVFASYGFGNLNSIRTPTVESFHEFTDWMLHASDQLPEIEIRKLDNSEISAAEEFYKSVNYLQTLDQNSVYFAAFLNQEVIGIVRLAREEKALVLRGMQVLPEFQFFGIGTKLLRLLEQEIGNEDCYCLPHGWLENFYGQIGFKIVSDMMVAPAFLTQRFEKYLETYPEIIMMRRRRASDKI